MTLATHPITDLPALHPKTTWGSTTINSDAQINLYFGLSEEPIRVKLNHPIILGHATRTTFLRADVDLTPYGAAEKGVSRQHVVIEVMKEVVIMTDMGSTNGTYLNGCRLYPNKVYVVRDGDEIRLGNLIGNIYF